MSLAGSWRIGGEVTLPICSPLYEGHAGLVRLEIGSGISLKVFFESKLQLPCYGIVLRFVICLCINKCLPLLFVSISVPM